MIDRAMSIPSEVDSTLLLPWSSDTVMPKQSPTIVRGQMSPIRTSTRAQPLMIDNPKNVVKTAPEISCLIGHS